MGDDDARISIDKVSDDGEPLEPIESRSKFINQCGALFRDMIPITLQEWHKPKDVNSGATNFDDRRKELLWEMLLTHVNLPRGLIDDKKEKVMEWTLKKMAVQFQSWKKTLWSNYQKKKQAPEFTGALEKIKHD